MKLPQSLAAILLMAVAPLGAYAQKPADYPVKPVRVILGLAAGGGLDTMTRALSTKLSERWGQSVVVENRATAGGVVAVETVVKAEPDGYTNGIWRAEGNVMAHIETYSPIRGDQGPQRVDDATSEIV